MGKPKNEKPGTDLDVGNDVGKESGTKDMAGTATTSPLADGGAPQAIAAEGSPELAAAERSDNTDADKAAALPGAAVAAGSQAETQRLTIAELALATSAAAKGFALQSLDEELPFTMNEAQIMAEFVRANPDAPVLAMYTHLCLQMRYDQAVPNPADMLALSLFHAACLAAHQFERTQAVAVAMSEFANKFAGAWPGDLAMMPAENALAATGFTPQG